MEDQKHFTEVRAPNNEQVDGLSSFIKQDKSQTTKWSCMVTCKCTRRETLRGNFWTIHLTMKKQEWECYHNAETTRVKLWNHCV